MDPQVYAIAIGLIVSLIFTELFGLAAGGMIVPGYFALSLNRPLELGLTAAAALITFALVRLISSYAIVYGRRRIVLMILTGFLVGTSIRVLPLLFDGGATWGSSSLGHFAVIGFIIPGLIALWIDRQGLVETLGTLTTSSVVVRLVLILLPLELLS